MPKFIYGRNPVKDAIVSKAALSVFMQENIKCNDIVSLAKNSGIKINYVKSIELEKMVNTNNHQGFVAEINDYHYYQLDEIINLSKVKQYPLILILDGIEDPHNLGAIIRSADVFGVDGIIIKKKNQVPVNSTVYKISTGAVDHVRIAQVSNLTRSIETLKKAGFWIVSSDGSATKTYKEVDYKCPIALIIGSEGFGISRLVLENSDFIIKIPMEGHVNSLNASVATGVLLALIKHLR